MRTKQNILIAVEEWVVRHPEDFADIVLACNKATLRKVRDLAEQEADMESALAQMLFPKLPKKRKLENVRGWLVKWRGRTALNWDWYWNTVED